MQETFLGPKRVIEFKIKRKKKRSVKGGVKNGMSNQSRKEN